MDDRPIKVRPEDSAPPPEPYHTLVGLRQGIHARDVDVRHFAEVLERTGDPLSKLAKVREFLREQGAAIAALEDEAETLSRALRYHGYPTAGGSTPDVGARP